MTDDGVRFINRPRADLTGLKSPRSVKQIFIEAPVDSWTGIERFPELFDLAVFTGARAEDIERLAAVSKLRWLKILDGDFTDGNVALLESIVGLERVQLEARGVETSRCLAAANFSAAAGLEHLGLVMVAGRLLEFDAGWIAGLRELRSVILGGVVITDDVLAILGRLPHLQNFLFSFVDDDSVDRIRTALPDVKLGPMHWEPFVERGPEELMYIDEVPEEDREPGHDLRWDLTIDLASLWGSETQYDGEAELRRLIRERLPDIESELVFDTEAQNVWILCARREPLESIVELVSDESRHR